MTSSTINRPGHEHNAAPVAIIGGSFAGLTLANALHLKSIPYTILDCKSFPFTCVVGGAKFNVPSYELIAKKLELDMAVQCSENDGPTRKNVISALIERVYPNLIASQRIVRIEQKSGLFYLHSQQTYNPKDEKSDIRILGPFQSVVGADGVLSKVRVGALRNTFLIGDARWVNDRWYDLGIRRINRGADMALMDGLELGNAMIRNEHKSPRSKIRKKFCAYEISWLRTMRTFAIVAITLALITFKFQRECRSIYQNVIYALKDTVFDVDCLNHDRSNALTF